MDFNLFPIGLIDHIDILKDGASPVYGTDAVAGVVNVFLIHKFRGVELYASYGNTNLGSANDMSQEIGYVLAGTGDDKTNLVVFSEYFNQAGIFSRDLDISRTLDYRPFGGADSRSGNYAGRVGNFVYQRSLNGGARTPTPHSAANVATNPEYIAQFTPVIAPSDRQYFYGSADHTICDKYLVAFVDFEHSRRFWHGGVAPRPVQGDIWTDSTHPFGISDGGFSVPIQNAFNPFTVPDYISPGGTDPNAPATQVSAAPPGTGFTTGVRYRFLEGGLGQPKVTASTNIATAGLHGNLGLFGDYFKTWNWESAFRWNEDAHIEKIDGLINNYALRTALLDSNPATAFDPFGLNQNRPDIIRKLIISTQEYFDTTLLTQDLTLNGDLFNLPAGPVSFAMGGQYLKNHITDQPDALTAAGQVGGFSTFSLVKGTRDNWSAFWEVRLPVTSPTWNVAGLHSLELDYAERFEDYSDFGQTERPKFSIRWQPFGGSPVPLTLRASYIEAFHAPSLVDLFAGHSNGFPPIDDPVTGKFIRGVPADFLGNPNLQPEIAYEYTCGGVLTPAAWWDGFRGLTLTVDYGHIDLRGFTTQLDPQFIVDNEEKFPGLVTRNPVTQQIEHITVQTRNLGGMIQSYIDYEAVEQFETQWLGHGDWGTFTATFSGTYLMDVDIRFLPDDPLQSVVGKFGGGFQGTTGGGSFTHNRCYASLFYDGSANSWLHGLDTGITIHYIGQYWDNKFFTFYSNKPRDPTDPESRPVGVSDRKVREWTTVDLILNYTFESPARTLPNDVPGQAKEGGAGGKEGKATSTAAYNPCGWQACLNNTTLTIGVNNAFDLAPPFVAAAVQATGAAENGFDEATANAKGRFCYIAIKKRF